MYIHSVCSISALPLITKESAFPALSINSEVRIQAPKYSDYIPPMQLRRMNKALRNGLTAAIECYRNNGQGAVPLVAVTVGTAYGLLQDSQNFLNAMLAQNEASLAPTSFIQSTHNTVAGAIALGLQSNVHNMTFVNKGHSFENALLDIELVLNEHPEGYGLVGGVEESIPILEWVLGEPRNGQLIGEGASFLLLSNQAVDYLCTLKSYDTFKTNNTDFAMQKIAESLVTAAEQTEKCPRIIWNSSTASHINYANQIIDVSAIIGFNPSGAAGALVLGVKLYQEEAVPVVVVNQFQEYWSVFILV